LFYGFYLGRISVGTWNVAGKPPGEDLNIEEWLDMSQPADIYVLGWVLLAFCLHMVWFSSSYSPLMVWDVPFL
jgi:hypothetical protein